MLVLIYVRSLRGTKTRNDKAKYPEPKAKAKGAAELETGGRRLCSACDTKQRAEKGNRRKLSTGIERGKQRGRKEPERTEGTAVRGDREEGKGKHGRLSSQKQAEATERERKAGGKARKRSGREEAEKKGSTGGTAVGAKPGGTKGNKQQAKYENREQGMGNQAGTNGENRGSVSGSGTPGKPL